MRSKRILSLIAVAALSATMLVGCGNDSKETSAEGDKPAAEAKFKDGKYEAELEVDERGNKPVIEVEVKDGKIASAKYNEVNEEKGTDKLSDAEYNKSMKEKSGTNPEEAFPKLAEALVEKQDASAVDVVTGATGSSESFKAVATKALESAKK